MIYLDNAATTLIKPLKVKLAVIEAMDGMASPGRGGHLPAMRAAEEVYSCRETAARLFNLSDPERVVFTMNATHGLNIALASFAAPGARLLMSGFEHNSVSRPARAWYERVDIAGRRLFDRQSVLEDFQRKLPGASVAVCTHVSNVFGFVLPIYEIAELCRENGVPLIVDASQSAGILQVDMERLGAAFIAMPGHKALFGPQGTGMLLCGEEGRPLLHGGSGSDSVPQHMPDYLPDRLEAGTHNVPGIAGLRAGMNFVMEKGTENILRHERKLLELAKEELKGTGLELFTGEGEQQSGVLSLRHPQMDCELFARRLSERGVCVRSGMHCAPTAHESAGTIAGGTVRLSFSAMSTVKELREACAIVRQVV